MLLNSRIYSRLNYETLWCPIYRITVATPTGETDKLSSFPTRPLRPLTVTLCGSTRFKDAFVEANRRESLAGHIVLSVGLFGHQEGLDMSGPVKAALDQLHLRKVDMADEVLVLNERGYVGESMRREVEYARQTGKRVRSLEPLSAESDPAEPVTHDTPERLDSLTPQPWPGLSLSPLVTDWALCMDAEMRANRGKGAEVDWLRCEPTDLWKETMDHAAKLLQALREKDFARVREFAADTANLAMMTRDTYTVRVEAEAESLANPSGCGAQPGV